MIIKVINYINAGCLEYYPIISTGFGIASTVFIGYRIIVTFKDKSHAKNVRLNDIEKRLHHLDDPKTGRVHKLSKMVEQEIDTNKKAFALAHRVNGRLDERVN